METLIISPASVSRDYVLASRELIKKGNGRFNVEYNPEYMQLAINESERYKTEEGCGPFGAVVMYDNIILGLGHNKVVKNNDVTAHAEIMAIRCASEFLGSHDLTGCVLYSSCEPCPMCLTAIKLSNIEKYYFNHLHS